MGTKYAIVMLAGAADASADGRPTPLETASTPNIDALASEGRGGLVRTIPAGLPAGSDVALMSLLGYDPAKYYTGRGPIEAVARNVRLEPDAVVFRCNLVTIVDGDMADHSAGRIRDAEAREIVDALNRCLGGDVRFVHDRSYRNLLVMRGADLLDVACIPPHEILGEPAKTYRPKGRAADRLLALMRRADEIVANHDVNLVRRDLGETPATAIWPWGQGVTPIMRRFRMRFGVVGAAAGDAGLMGGLAKLLGWMWLTPTAGDAGTDAAVLAQLAIDALEAADLVIIHVETPIEAALAGDSDGKVAAIERIDAEIVGPIVRRLKPLDSWRIMLFAGPVALTSQRRLTTDPSMFLIAGSGVPRRPSPRFIERFAADCDLRVEQGHELMEYFLRR